MSAFDSDGESEEKTPKQNGVKKKNKKRELNSAAPKK